MEQVSCTRGLSSGQPDPFRLAEENATQQTTPPEILSVTCITCPFAVRGAEGRAAYNEMGHNLRHEER